MKLTYEQEIVINKGDVLHITDVTGETVDFGVIDSIAQDGSYVTLRSYDTDGPVTTILKRDYLVEQFKNERCEIDPPFFMLMISDAEGYRLPDTESFYPIALRNVDDSATLEDLREWAEAWSQPDGDPTTVLIFHDVFPPLYKPLDVWHKGVRYG